MVKMVWVDAYVGNPFHSTRMSRVSRPGVSRQMFAAISPVVYICATPGERSSPSAMNLSLHLLCASSIQSCSPVVSR
jgi:hypothetical protein